MANKVRKEKFITPIGTSFVEFIVPYLMREAFSAYRQRNFTKSYFQVNPWENSHTAAATVLTALAIEAYRNRIYYLEKEEISGSSVSSDVSKIFNTKLLSFPSQKFESIVKEVFVIRDVIVHSHVYELDVLLNEENWDMINYSHTKLSGYGDGKFKGLVNAKAGETNLVRFNVQPLKIGFEDLFKVLLVFDLFTGIAERAFGKGYVSFYFMQEFNNRWAENLSEFLTHYYDQIPNPKFLKQVEKLSKELRKDFASFLPDNGDYFIRNTCPKCSTLGFRKLNNIYRCEACGLEIGWLKSDTSIETDK